MLYAGGSDADGNCAVSTTYHTGDWCTSTRPMRVCCDGHHTDPLYNYCNWIGCGLGTHTNQYFGGCNDGGTAGALCCPQ